MKNKITVLIVLLTLASLSFADQIIQRHKIKKGENLASLATKYNTSVEQLKKWNGITGNRIYPGQIIIVGKYQSQAKTNDAIYIVKKGDSLFSISKKTGVSVEKLKAYNNLGSDNLFPGQKLVLSKTDKQSSQNKENSQTSFSANNYCVKKGDTISAISKKTGVSVDEIKKLNNLKNDKLAIGQKLVLGSEKKIIATDTQYTITASSKKITEKNAANVQATAQVNRIIVNKYHTIKKGETLSRIASKYNTSVSKIKKLNNLKSNLIQPGKTIIVARIIKEIPPQITNPTPIVPVSPKIYYSVKLGDTIESIASKFGISVSALKETNLLSDGKIKIGQTLVIPQVANMVDTIKEETSLSGNEKENSGSKLLAARIIENALNFINTPYRLGGLSERGIDCSGLTKKSYEAAGISLPRTSGEQAKTGEIVPISAIKPGDLLFFGHKGRINHVGIYIGDNKFVHASRESGKVVIANLDDAYYQKHLICARTLINGEQGYWIEQESN